uniref:Carbonic anhydrase n=1 Tax=Chelonoidis abingdonii TaxID=106734 RepID=A0A8C0HC81_CHEAB
MWVMFYPLLFLSPGPRYWKDLAKGCGGDNQSPINIDRRKVQRDRNLGDVLFEGYDQAPPGKWRLMNNGHTVMMRLEGVSASEHINITIGVLLEKYRALQFHFHWGNLEGNGSEHTIDGHQFPMELHLVHMNTKYKTVNEAKGHPNGLAVLGFLYKVGQKHPALGLHVHGQIPSTSTFCLNNLLPSMAKLSKYYRYQGSLTTPDCAEVVVWTLFEEPIPIIHFPANGTGTSLVKMTNNFRLPQPLKNRKVYASRDATISRSAMPSVSLPLLPLLLVFQIVHFSGPS